MCSKHIGGDPAQGLFPAVLGWGRQLAGCSRMGVPQQQPLLHPFPTGPGVCGRRTALGQCQHPAPRAGGVCLSPHHLLEHRAARQPCPAPGQGEHRAGRSDGAGGAPLTALILSQEQALQGEIAALRAQLREKDDALQSTAERLHSMARLKDSMEQFIVSQRRWHGQAGPVPALWGRSVAWGPH